MDENSLIIHALKKIVIERSSRGAYGLVVIGIPNLPLQSILESFKNELNIYISFVGSKDKQEPLVKWAKENLWESSRLGFNATHAVDVRNEAPDDAIKLTFVWEEEDRLHSLIERGYQYIGPSEIIERIAKFGEEKAENVPQKNLWQALGSEELTPYIALKGISEYYLKWFNPKSSDFNLDNQILIDIPRDNLVLLDLLPDKELLAKNYVEKEKIIKRLVLNAKIVERIQRADEEDRLTAIKTLKQNSMNEKRSVRLKRNYNAYLHLTRGDYSVLNELELEEALFLLSGKKYIEVENEVIDQDDSLENQQDEDTDQDQDTDTGPDTDTGIDGEDTTPFGNDDFVPGNDENYTGNGIKNPNNKLTIFENFNKAAIKLVANGETTALEALVNEVQSLFHQGKIEKTSLSINHGKYTIQTEFIPNKTAISITKNFSQKTNIGGVIDAPDVGLENIFKKLGQYLDKATFYDEIKVKTLMELMNKVEEIIESFKGKALLENFINTRSDLLMYSDLLSVEPLACLLSNIQVKEKVSKYINQYEALLEHLDEHYSELYKESPEGAILINKEILSLDTIKIISQEDISVILSALNPLVLWKYLELANLILNDNEKLPLNDIDLLIKEINDLPEPLLAIYSSLKSDAHEKLGYSHRIGALPIYRTISTEMSDLSQKSIGTASLKLASLYPPVKENLRILLIDPVSTTEFSRTMKQLFEKYGFKKATLIVVKMSRQNIDNELPFDALLKELVFENKIEIEVLKLQSVEKLQKYLKDKPVHILGVSGEKTKNVKLIETEETKLHPLSVPHKLHVDPLIGRVTLKPRSIKSEDGGTKHPFDAYHKVISEITGNHRSEFSMQETNNTAIQDINELLPYSQFVLTIGQIAEITDNKKLLRLTQNIEQSGDTVYTYHKDGIINRLSSHLKKFNYQPTENGLMNLLNRLQSVGGEGVFSTISEKGINGFSETGVKGLLGLAVALNWYMNNSMPDKNIVVSLDSYLARKWLNKRDNQKRSDFLGIRQLKDESYTIDILEVKGYESTNETDVLDSNAADQLRSIAQVITNIIKKQGDLFTDRRRELLRLQIFRESLQLNAKQKNNWIKVLNSIIDGDQKVTVNLILLEVAFDQNIEIKEQIFYAEKNSGLEKDNIGLPITRIRFGEKDIQKYLGDYVEKINLPTIVTPPVIINEIEKEKLAKKEEASTSYSSDTNSGDINTSELNIKSEVEEVKKEKLIKGKMEKDKVINSEITLLLGSLADWEKPIYWDHRREIENPLVNHNIIITGDPGKGKTQTIKGLMHELRENGIPLLTFDFKDDYIDDDFLEKENIKKFDVMSNGLPFNPLVPAIDPIENKFTAINHIVQIESILKRVYGLGVQQATTLRSAIREAFIRKGIQPNVPTSLEEINGFPNFQEVFEILNEEEKKNASLIGRLDLLFQIGIFPNEPAINFEELMEGSYTLRLSTLPDPDNEIKAAVAEIIILAVHNYLISKEHPRKLTRAIILDEAHRVSNSRALLNLMREGRAFGVGMLIATQFPTDIPQDVYGCTETKLFLGNDGVEHAEAAAKKLEGGTSKHNVNVLADQIRGMKQFRAVLRNSQHTNIFIDLKPYYQRK